MREVVLLKVRLEALGEGGGIQVVVVVVLIHRRADLKMREAAL